MLFVVLSPGTPEGSIVSGSGFKASQKTGKGLKSHPTCGNIYKILYLFFNFQRKYKL